MAKQTGKQIVQDSTEALARSGEAVETVMKGNADALTESGNASRAAVQELTKAYQELATRNARNLTAAMRALAAAKSPAEFIELQQRLIKEGVVAAVGDSQRVAQLTTAVVTAAFERVKKRIAAAQRPAPLSHRFSGPAGSSADGCTPLGFVIVTTRGLRTAWYAEGQSVSR